MPHEQDRLGDSYMSPEAQRQLAARNAAMLAAKAESARLNAEGRTSSDARLTQGILLIAVALLMVGAMTGVLIYKGVNNA